MTKIIGSMVIIGREKEGVCELCGAVAELRPYGTNGENICYECGMKDKETTNRKIAERFSTLHTAVDNPIIIRNILTASMYRGDNNDERNRDRV